MRKKIINYESLIAGALLYFEKLDMYDIKILLEEIKKHKDIEFFNVKLKNIEKYLECSNDDIRLKENLNFKTEINTLLGSHTIEEQLKKHAGDSINDFFEKMDLEKIVLEKIKLMKNVNKGTIIRTFNNKEFDIINILLTKGYISSLFNKDLLYTDLEEIQLTKMGNLNLFILNNKEEYNNFVKEVANSSDITKLNDYLLSFKNLDNTILSIEKYNTFINENKKVNYVDDSKVDKIDSNYKFQSIKTNLSIITCHLGNSKLKRPINTKPCGCSFELNEDNLFAIKNGLLDSYYTLCPNCGFIVKVPSESISKDAKYNLQSRKESDRDIYKNMCEKSSEISEEYYAKDIFTKHTK